MPIPRNSGRMAALVAALTLAGCGSSSGEEQTHESTCDYNTLKKGCVGILNFRSTTSVINGVSVPPRFQNATGHTEPGTATVMVDDSSLSSKHAYQGTLGGQAVNVTCTVTNLGWIDVNPAVIIQQEAFGALVNCSNW